ncbi:MAG: CoA transferase, partial [Chloroflexi bacterium]|nr:CoA transferase [Chloroflexota bacterium]
MPGALEGIRVVELSQFIAAPTCGLVLADMGAEVIKVEKPQGENARHIGPFKDGHSLYVGTFNRNKKGITLDFRKEEGRELLRDLINHSDVVVENFKPGVMAEMGCDYEGLRALNRGLIMVSISGFGQHGPYRDLPGLDMIVQAMSGAMYLNGLEGEPPLKLGVSLADYSAGLYGAIGALLALYHRKVTGEGQYVDVALFDSMISLLETSVAEWVTTGHEPPRTGNARPHAAPTGAYPTTDGHVYLSGATNALWGRLLQVMERPDLASDPRFQTNQDRTRHRGVVDEAVTAWTSVRTTAATVRALRAGGVVCGPVQRVRDVVGDPQVSEREMIV